MRARILAAAAIGAWALGAAACVIGAAPHPDLARLIPDAVDTAPPHPDFAVPGGRSPRIGVAPTTQPHGAVLNRLQASFKVAGDEYWSTDFGRRGVWGRVYALGEDNGDLVIAGRFSFAGATPAKNVARWDGDSWQPYGDGIGVTETYWGFVYAVVKYGERLVVGGDFLGADQDTIIGVQAAFWDGLGWHSMDQGDWQGHVYAFQVYHGRLYAGGTFWRGQRLEGVLVWDGDRWQSLNAPFIGGWGLSVFDDKLVVAGGELYAWDEHGWSQPYGETTGGGFLCATTWNGNLAAGGAVTGIRYNGNWVGVRNVALWDGMGWQPLGTGLYGFIDENYEDISVVITLATRGNDLCAGGRFYYTEQDGQDVWAPYAARWTGDHWEGLGGGVTNDVYAMVERGSDLVVGGFMGYAGHVNIPEHTGDVDVWGIGTWDGTEWHAFGPPGKGLNGPVHCLTLYDNRIIAAGTFTLAGQTTAKGIAQFDGTNWEPLGGGLEYSTYYVKTCHSMAEYEGDLIVLGKISRAGEVPVLNVARWGGQQWSGMGAGIPDPGMTELYPMGLGVHNGTLYAERYRWTGTSWDEAFPVDGTVCSYCDWHGVLVIGGSFQHVGNLAVNHIVAWDGTDFTPLGDGLPGAVNLVTVQGDDLIACMHLPGYIARWDGTTWQPYRSGFNNWVQVVASQGDHLFVGGPFANAYNESGQALHVNRVAHWDGAAWYPMGSGCGGEAFYRFEVYGLVVYQGALFVAGDFGLAGNKPSWFVGRWRDPLVPIFLRRFSVERRAESAVVVCELGEPFSGDNGERLEVWRALPGSERSLTGAMPATGSLVLEFVDSSPPVGEADYWLREVSAAGGETWLGSAHLAAAPVPARLTLSPSAPNPFNPRTTIRYALPQTTRVRLAVYDQRGRLVRTLVDGSLPAGEHTTSWDGEDGWGRAVASGAYVVRLVTEQGVRAGKAVLAR